MNLDPKDLLLSKRLEAIPSDPFCFFSVDDYLPEDLYRELLASYPEGVDYSYDDDGKAGFRSSVYPDAVARFCASQPAWQQLIDFFSSDSFVEDLRTVFRGPLRAARPWSARRRWVNHTQRAASNNFTRYLTEEPVRTTFQFSKLARGKPVMPHSDAPRKLVSLLLYFRDPDWRDDWGGGTEYYQPLDPVRARSWKRTARVPFAEFKTVGTTGFVGNRLAGFVRCDASYHGVPPVTCPVDRSRKALLINIKRLTWSKRHQL